MGKHSKVVEQTTCMDASFVPGWSQGRVGLRTTLSAISS
uniref:Uncharacterized protein n=1 Tax=Arundo donax TaxID=35708 RepID=A0A0A8ZXJ7_ARUDO